jgi:HK97 gp10 family phage protein
VRAPRFGRLQTGSAVIATNSNLEGVAQLTRQLIALGKLDDGKPLRTACRNAMKPAYQRALAKIPVGTEPHRLSSTYGKLLVAPGYAKQTLKIATTINAQKNVASAVMSVTKPAFYAAIFVELGTRYQQAQPWLRPAFFDARSDAEQAFRSTLAAAVEKAAKTA